MEKKVSRKVEAYVTEFKKNIVQKINDLEMKDRDKINGFCQFVYNYPRINLTKEDFQKRKRVKNKVPLCYRCSARRANKEQCTRRRKEGHTLRDTFFSIFEYKYNVFLYSIYLFILSIRCFFVGKNAISMANPLNHN